MTIGEAAAQAGVAASAIRYYEKLGLLPAPARKGGQRRYDGSAVRRLRLIAAAREAGLPLAAIGELFQPGPVADRWKQIVQARLDELERSRQLLSDLCECRCKDISECERRLAARYRESAPESARRPGC